MRGYCLNQGVYEEDVQDVIHNAWIRVLAGLHSYDKVSGDLGPWVMGCLRHAVGDWRRVDTFGRDRRKVEFCPVRSAHAKAVAGAMEDRILEKIDRERLRRSVRVFLKLLSPRQERLLTRHYLDERTWADIAAEDGVTENAAKLAGRYGFDRLGRTIKAAIWPDLYSPPRRANARC